MPPFGTCFQSKSDPAAHFRRPRTDCQAGDLPAQGQCGLGLIALARADARPRLSLFRSAWDFMAEMEATMTWKVPPRGRYLLAARHARLHVRPTSFEFCRSAPV